METANKIKAQEIAGQAIEEVIDLLKKRERELNTIETHIKVLILPIIIFSGYIFAMKNGVEYFPISLMIVGAANTTINMIMDQFIGKCQAEKNGLCRLLSELKKEEIVI